MTQSIFVDTSFFLAILNPRDKYHHAARTISADLTAPLITSEAILIELGNALSKQALRTIAGKFLRDVRNDTGLEIVAVNTDLLDTAIQFFRSRPDKEWGMTDCISFVIMQKYAISAALTTDHHFIQAGFTRLIPQH